MDEVLVADVLEERKKIRRVLERLTCEVGSGRRMELGESLEQIVYYDALPREGPSNPKGG